MSFIYIRIKSHFHVNGFYLASLWNTILGQLDMASLLWGSQWPGVTVRSQTAKNLTASRRKSINHQKSKLILTVKKFLGTSNLTFSADLNWTSSSWRIQQVEPMFSKTLSLDITITYNLVISKNVSEFLQVKRQDSLKNKTVSINLYRS